VLGELIVGVILGPSLIDLLHATPLGLNNEGLRITIANLAELGVLLLMFKIGMDVHIEELFSTGRIAITAGLLGALLPAAVTALVVSLFGFAWPAALFAGVTLAATSVSISAQVMLELGVLQTREGRALLATALVDDVAALLLVAFTSALIKTGGSVEPGPLLQILGSMLLYLAGALALAWFAVPRLMNWAHRQPSLTHAFGLQALALVIALLFGWLAQTLGGIAAITGAFIAGLGINRADEQVKRPVETAINDLAYILLVPIFFVSVGLNTDLHLFPLSAVPLAAALLLIAMLTKIIGCSYPALRAGFSRSAALRFGVAMISRGEVGLIIASLGVSSGAFPSSSPVFASLFLVILLTTVVTPPLLRRAFAVPEAALPQGA
jgi:Kef-type K+ transport system membrane component KefB